MVKPMMLNPKLLKNILYNTTRPLIIGPMIIAFQMALIVSNGYPLAPLSESGHIDDAWFDSGATKTKMDTAQFILQL